MPVNPDFRDLLSALNDEKAEYLLVDEIPIHIIGKNELMASKRAAGRLQDQLDLEKLDS